MKKQNEEINNQVQPLNALHQFDLFCGQIQAMEQLFTLNLAQRNGNFKDTK